MLRYALKESLRHDPHYRALAHHRDAFGIRAEVIGQPVDIESITSYPVSHYSQGLLKAIGLLRRRGVEAILELLIIQATSLR